MPHPTSPTAELLSILAECFAARARIADDMRQRVTHNTAKAALHGESAAYAEVASMLAAFSATLQKPLDVPADSRTLSLIDSLRKH